MMLEKAKRRTREMIEDFSVATEIIHLEAAAPDPDLAAIAFFLQSTDDYDDWVRIKTWELMQRDFIHQPDSGFYLLGDLVDQLQTDRLQATTGRHPDDDLKALLRAVIFLEHEVSSYNFDFFTKLAQVPNAAAVKTWMMNWKRTGQHQELCWLEAKIRQYVEVTGGPLAYWAISRSSRMDIWGAIFDGAPTYICKTLWQRHWTMVDYAAIIYSNNPLASKWRAFVRLCFVFLCEETFRWKCIMEDDTTAGYLQASWKEMTWRCKEFIDIRAEVGGVRDVPILSGRFWRSKEAKAAMRSDGRLHYSNVDI